MTYTEGILGNGAAILNDGVMVPIEEVVSRLNDMDRYRSALEAILKHQDTIAGPGMTAYSVVSNIARRALNP